MATVVGVVVAVMIPSLPASAATHAHTLFGRTITIRDTADGHRWDYDLSVDGSDAPWDHGKGSQYGLVEIQYDWNVNKYPPNLITYISTLITFQRGSKHKTWFRPSNAKTVASANRIARHVDQQGNIYANPIGLRYDGHRHHWSSKVIVCLRMRGWKEAHCYAASGKYTGRYGSL